MKVSGLFFFNIGVLVAAALMQSAVLATTAESADMSGVRHVSGQVLTSPELPTIRLKFDEQFKYVGSQSFTLYDVAHAEQHFFVDADKLGRIMRFYWVQFEGYLPSNTSTYNYKINRQVNFGGFTFIADTFARNTINPRRPESDLEHAESFLESRGYHLERNGILLQRLVHLVGEDRRNELMIIYAENLRALGAQPNDVAEGILKRVGKYMTISR